MEKKSRAISMWVIGARYPRIVSTILSAVRTQFWDASCRISTVPPRTPPSPPPPALRPARRPHPRRPHPRHRRRRRARPCPPPPSLILLFRGTIDIGVDFCGARECKTEKAVLASAVARAKLSPCRGNWATVGCAMAGAEWPRALDVVADGTARPCRRACRSFKSWKKWSSVLCNFV